KVGRDEVGPPLARSNPEAARSQRFEQAERYRGFAHAARHPCDDVHPRCHRPRSSAGFAGAILSRGVASEGAPEAPSEVLTPADLNVAISLQIRAAARAR